MRIGSSPERRGYNSSMKIAFYADNFYPELSGIADTIITTGKELTKRGHEVVYVGPYYAPHNYALANRQYPATSNDDKIDDMLCLPQHLGDYGLQLETDHSGSVLGKALCYLHGISVWYDMDADSKLIEDC